MYIGIIQNGLDRHWCWKWAGFGKKFWVLGWLLLIYKLLCSKKVFIQFEGGLIVKYSYSMQCLDFLLGMSLLLTNQDRKHTAALITGSESLVCAKYWTLNCHSLLFSNPSSCLHEHTSQSAQLIDLFLSKLISPAGRLTCRHPFYCHFSSAHLSLEDWEFVGFLKKFLILNLFTFSAVGLSWYIAVIPVVLACVIVGGVCTHKCWKRRADKGYTTPKV